MAKNLTNVNLGTDQRQKSEFDLSHSNSTTQRWGDVQTTLCRYIPLGDTSISLDQSNFTRLAPLVAPTYGTIKQHDFFMFVPCSDIYPYFDDVLAGTPVTLNGTDTIINAVPSASNFDLTLYLLKHSYCRIFTHSGTTGTNYAVVKKTDYDNNYQNYFNATLHVGTEYANFLHDNIRYIGTDRESYYDATERLALSPSSADFVISFDSSGKDHFICFYLDLPSKLLIKHMRAAGYKPNLNVNEDYFVSLMPLLSIYKAYFDIFHITQYDNYKTSPIYKLFNYYHNNIPTGYTPRERVAGFSDEELLINDVLDALCVTLYTSDNDYVSCHTDANLPAHSLTTLRDFKYMPGTNATVAATSRFTFSQGYDVYPNYSAFNRFSQLDDELLKKMFLWVNRQSQSGFAIKTILQERGYSAFVENTESNFLGHHEMDINIETVTSMAGTDDTALGEYAGRGQQGSDAPHISFNANSYGYIIAFSSIVPSHTFCNAIQPSVLGIDRFTIYNPVFDGFGYEASPKAILGQNNQVTELNASPVPSTDAQSFGVKPRYTGYKTSSGQDVVNGDMIRPRYRNEYLPYFLNRYVTGSMLESEPVDADTDTYSVKQLIRPTLPSAGKSWRYPTLYEFLSNYNRLFRVWDIQSQGRDPQSWEQSSSTQLEEGDNFMCYFYFNLKIFSRMLPVEDSWMTEEDPGKEQTITVAK